MMKQTQIDTLYPSEKIRTGQSFLYRKNGVESMVIDIQLHETVRGDYLIRAADKACQRYAYLTQQLVECDGDFYLVENKQPLVVRHSSSFLPLGSDAVNGHLLDLHYDSKTIFISYHHGLCDGRGIMPFVRTLLFYYLSSFHQALPMPDAIQLSGSPLLANELKEPGYVSLSGEATGLPFPDGQEYILPEVRSLSSRPTISYLSQINLSHDSFMQYTKSIGATPSIALSLLMSRGIRQTIKESDKEIICNLVVDLRAGADLANTYRNCVSTLKLGFNPHTSIQTQAKEYKASIAQFKTKENLQYELKKIIGLSDRLDTLPSFEQKQKALSFLDTLHSDTYSLSYIGRLNLGAYEAYINEMHTYSSGTPGLSIEMIALDDYFCLDIMQSFDNRIYIEAFINELKANNIKFTVKEMKEIQTPSSSIMYSPI